MKTSGSGFDLPAKIALKEELEQKMAQPGFWDNPDGAKEVTSGISAVKCIIDPAEEALVAIIDIAELFELAVDENDAETLESIEFDLDDHASRSPRVAGQVERRRLGQQILCRCFG